MLSVIMVFVIMIFLVMHSVIMACVVPTLNAVMPSVVLLIVTAIGLNKTIMLVALCITCVSI
jgi:hypothetical protein